MKLDLSIVIPIYNVEAYLKKCLDSILKQKIKNFEVILVNDGSTDNSLKICREFSDQDKRVKVIDQKNAGVSAARNSGIKEAKGIYIGFVDPDDWIAPQMYSTLLNAAEMNNFDVVMCDYFEVRGEDYRPIKVNLSNTNLLETDICKYLIKPMIANEQLGMKTIWGCVWRLLIKKELITQNKIFFDESIPLMEDLLFTFNVLSVAKKVKYIEECYYYYLIRDGSAVTSFRTNLLENNLNVYNKLINSAKQYNNFNELEIAFKYRYITTMIDGILNECKLENKRNIKQKIIGIQTICENQRLQGYLEEINISSSNYKRRLFFNLIKKKKAFWIFLALRGLDLNRKVKNS